MILQWTTLLNLATTTFVTVQALPYASLNNDSISFISSLNKRRVVYSYHYSDDYSTAFSTSYSFKFPQSSGNYLQVPTTEGANSNIPTISSDESSTTSATSEITPRGKHWSTDTGTTTGSPSTITESTITTESTLITDPTPSLTDSTTSINSTSSTDSTSPTDSTSVNDTASSPTDGTSSGDQPKPTSNLNKMLSKERQVISNIEKNVPWIMKSLFMEKKLSPATQTFF